MRFDKTFKAISTREMELVWSFVEQNDSTLPSDSAKAANHLILAMLYCATEPRSLVGTVRVGHNTRCAGKLTFELIGMQVKHPQHGSTTCARKTSELYYFFNIICIICRSQHPCLSASHACKPQGEGGQTASSIRKLWAITTYQVIWINFNQHQSRWSTNDSMPADANMCKILLAKVQHLAECSQASHKQVAGSD